MRKLDERGFTFLELVVVTVVLIVLFGITTIFFLTPKDTSAKTHAAMRKLHTAALAQALSAYAAGNGAYPDDIPKKATGIGSPEDHYNLCAYLVPDYIEDIPIDPANGAKFRDSEDITKTTCDTKGIRYGSAYSIHQDRQGRIIISAPYAEETTEVILPKIK